MDIKYNILPIKAIYIKERQMSTLQKLKPLHNHLHFKNRMSYETHQIWTTQFEIVSHYYSFALNIDFRRHLKRSVCDVLSVFAMITDGL